MSLSPLERDLLRTEPLRRLHMVAHGGAASITTTQTYSRLEHSLGVFALAACFHPDPADQPLRAAALLHDVGHLPFSHTFEGVAGLNHHALGADLLREPAIADVLAAHGLEPHEIADLLSGRTPSALTPAPGLLSLDHLDSYVRSARFGARLEVEPARLLAALRLVDGAVSTDLPTARILVDLVCAEARLHASWDNLAPAAVLQRLVTRLLDAGRREPARLARMTDAQLWAALDEAPETRDEAEMLRTRPHLLRVRCLPDAAQADVRVPEYAASGWDFALRKIYSSAPLVGTVPLESAAPDLAEQLEDLQALPIRYRVWWAGAERRVSR
ncbi:HD domain-containing protein [Actinospica durhamensis]|uniref:HD domain-containing protein n=1 Tax=Actinospica durhamensis TaxID=1508375 RepID=A0A941EJK7_9ACTN|nr:HD domain-containing protein [Actinospica durhamensis]MBR7831712.1 HD domain-containing protein [Actinospica durhamensis]